MRVVLVLLLLLGAGSAEAYPQFQLSTGAVRCNVCHVSPAGGGVLTGYGRDEAGEAANLAFTYAQVPNLGIGLIVVAGSVLGPLDLSFYWPRELYRADRRGRRAALLAAVPYERLLPLPLAEVRALLGIEAPQVAHPEGILVASRGDEPRWRTGDDAGCAAQSR